MLENFVLHSRTYFKGDTVFGVRQPYVTMNTKVNEYGSHIEVVYHKQSFTCFRKGIEMGHIKLCDRSRKFSLVNGVLTPKNGNVVMQTLLDSLANSRKRALDMVYNFSLSNKWSYFVTLTFNSGIVDRYDDSAVKKAYKLFRQKLQNIYPKVKILAIPEHHKDGALHIHALVGGCDLSSFLSEAHYPDTDYSRLHDCVGACIKSKSGFQVYNLSLFDFGFSTVTCLDDGYNNLKLSNYLVKYFTKSMCMGYNCKSYFRTYNLNSRSSFMMNLQFSNVETLLSSMYEELFSGQYCLLHESAYETILKKDNERLTVFYFIRKKEVA